MNSRPLLRHVSLTIGCVLLAAACVTINVYFPEAAVKDLSERIEDAVAREAAKPATEATPSDGSSVSEDGSSMSARAEMPPPRARETAATPGEPRLAALGLRAVGWILALTATEVDAQEVAAPEVTSPAIRRLIASRAQRVAELDRFKAAGALGESNAALLEVRDLQALSLPDRARSQKLMREENADRERMFREIAAATGADLASLPQIQSTYAETLRQRAAEGHWIQNPDGQWLRKAR